MSSNKIIEGEYCSFPSCGKESDVIWLGVGLCTKHNEWKNNNNLETAYKKLNVKREKILKNICEFKEFSINKKGLYKFIEE